MGGTIHWSNKTPKPIGSTTGIRGQRTITILIVRCNTRTARQPYAHGSTVLPWSRTRPRRRAQQGCESGSITQTTVPELISVSAAPDQIVELYPTLSMGIFDGTGSRSLECAQRTRHTGRTPLKYVKGRSLTYSGWTGIRRFTGGHSSENHWRLCKRPRRTYPSPSYRSPQADHRRPSQF